MRTEVDEMPVYCVKVWHIAFVIVASDITYTVILTFVDGQYDQQVMNAQAYYGLVPSELAQHDYEHESR